MEGEGSGEGTKYYQEVRDSNLAVRLAVTEAFQPIRPRQNKVQGLEFEGRQTD